MFAARYIAAISALLFLLSPTPGLSQPQLGPLFHDFSLTLSPGHRQETLGPLFYYQDNQSSKVWASSPLFSYTRNPGTDFEEFDFLYPILTYDRYGPEYRFQLFQLFSFAGGQSMLETNSHRFTLFPFYFQQRSPDPDKNYTALLPIYGRLQNRLFRDEVHFALMPLYVKSRKRDVVTWNVPYPVFHIRRGDGLTGWQLWPLLGHERKEITTRTNMWEELETVPGHKKSFALWPIFLNQTTDIGTENPARHHAILPLYSHMKSTLRHSTTAPWPLGFTYTVDREKQFTEWGAPWPIIVFARGEGKTTTRIWPLFSHARTDTLQSTSYLWPLYKSNRINSEPLARRRTRILLFLYSDLTEKNTITGTGLHRVDFWPLFTFRKDFENNRRLQILALLEPLLPASKSIERNYSQIWSLWRSETNAKTGATSQSLLWNLYRRDTTPTSKKCSLLFGLFQYHSTPQERRWRWFHIPVGRTTLHPPAKDPVP